MFSPWHLKRLDMSLLFARAKQLESLETVEHSKRLSLGEFLTMGYPFLWPLSYFSMMAWWTTDKKQDHMAGQPGRQSPHAQAKRSPKSSGWVCILNEPWWALEFEMISMGKPIEDDQSERSPCESIENSDCFIASYRRHFTEKKKKTCSNTPIALSQSHVIHGCVLWQSLTQISMEMEGELWWTYPTASGILPTSVPTGVVVNIHPNLSGIEAKWTWLWKKRYRWVAQKLMFFFPVYRVQSIRLAEVPSPIPVYFPRKFPPTSLYLIFSLYSHHIPIENSHCIHISLFPLTVFTHVFDRFCRNQFDVLLVKIGLGRWLVYHLSSFVPVVKGVNKPLY